MGLPLRFDFDGHIGWRELRELVETKFPGRVDFRVGPTAEGHRCLIRIGGMVGSVTVEPRAVRLSVWAASAHHEWLYDLLQRAGLKFVSPTTFARRSRHSFDYALGPGDPAHYVLFVGEPDGTVRFAMNVGFVTEEFRNQFGDLSDSDESDIRVEFTNADTRKDVEDVEDVEHLSELLRRTIRCCRQDLLGWLDAQVDERIFLLLR